MSFYDELYKYHSCSNFRIIIKFTEQTISVLDEENPDSDNSIPMDSLNGACEFAKQDTSPFSTKKHMYGKGEMSDQATHHVSDEVIKRTLLC